MRTTFHPSWQAAKPRGKHTNVIGKEPINQKRVLVWPLLLLKTGLMAESLEQEANLVISLSDVQTVVLVSIKHMCAAPTFLPTPRSQLFGTFNFFIVAFFSLRLSQTQKKTKNKNPVPFGIHIKVLLRLRDSFISGSFLCDVFASGPACPRRCRGEGTSSDSVPLVKTTS